MTHLSVFILTHELLILLTRPVEAGKGEISWLGNNLIYPDFVLQLYILKIRPCFLTHVFQTT